MSNPVPCNGCTECCKRDAIRLMPQDDASQYKTEPHPYPTPDGDRMLAHKPNKDCWYLGEGGCTIHDRRPYLCRQFDCRTLVDALTYTQARKLVKRGGLQGAVWRRAKQLIASDQDG